MSDNQPGREGVSLSRSLPLPLSLSPKRGSVTLCRLTAPELVVELDVLRYD